MGYEFSRGLGVWLWMVALSAPPVARAQGKPAGISPAPTAIRLQSLSRARADDWLASAPVIHCSPAPLTERPTAAAELRRHGVAPMEATFLDAAIAKGTFSYRPPVHRSGARDRSGTS
jgi:hypothetical protein